MSLLSANDFKFLKDCLLHREEKTLEKNIRDISIKARTLRAEPPWDVSMILQIQVEKGNVAFIQNFKSTEEAKQRLRSWEEMFR